MLRLGVPRRPRTSASGYTCAASTDNYRGAAARATVIRQSTARDYTKPFHGTSTRSR